MARLAWVTTVYALLAALLVAAPLSASEEALPVDEPAAAQEPVTPEPVVEEPVEPAPAPAEPAPPPAEPPPAPTEPQPAEPAPAPSAPSKPQAIRDELPVDEPRARAAASTTVTISDFQFSPAAITVNVGDTVTWSNSGPTSHSATANDGSFDTGIYGAGQSRSHTFDRAGTFSYICTPHPQMKGTVTVQAAATGGDDDSTSGGDQGQAGSGTGGGDQTGGPTLPATGRDSGGLLALGLVTLALGAYLRRRTG